MLVFARLADPPIDAAHRAEMVCRVVDTDALDVRLLHLDRGFLAPVRELMGHLIRDTPAGDELVRLGH